MRCICYGKDERFGGFETCLVKNHVYFYSFLEQGSVKNKECIQNVCDFNGLRIIGEGGDARG
jgi:hypothetical protein